MARSVSVKLPTSVVVEMIENKLAEMAKAEVEYPKLLSTYKKQIVSFTADLIDLVSKNKKSIVDYSDYGNQEDNISINSDYRGSVSIAVGKEIVAKIGEKPEKPSDPATWQNRDKKEKLEKTLALLKLTTQETITSSTYNSVLELL